MKVFHETVGRNWVVLIDCIICILYGGRVYYSLRLIFFLVTALNTASAHGWAVCGYAMSKGLVLRWMIGKLVPSEPWKSIPQLV